ncbi:MAG: T9SS type A sorting domain-containing protein [Bacteroidetes bacterium]|nr:T9SS type A sorting domain-containing protein [Bacteroidota bacterium]
MKFFKLNLIIAGIVLLSNTSSIKGQTTPAGFYGQNAWMPDTLGTTFFNGYLHKNWGNIKTSNVKIVRLGGTAANNNKPSPYQYLKMVDSVRAKGMEPLLQVPTGSGYDSLDARNVVKYINKTKNRKVKYWSIGNEPSFNAMAISAKIKKYASAMKNEDPTIKIVGPETTYMPGDQNDTYARPCMDSLTSLFGAASIMGTITGFGNANGKAFVDFFSYHLYNFEGVSTTPTKQSLIAQLTAPNKDTTAMGYIKAKCDAANANIVLGRSSQPISPVITEANICWYNGSTASNDNFGGVKTSSFFGGQHIAELMSWGIYKRFQWINLWSSIEGYESGYLSNSTTPSKKSTYYHMEQMGKWFTGTHYVATVDTGNNIKAFASKTGAYIAVMVLNQNVSGSASKLYNISFDNSTNGPNVHVKFNAGVTANFDDTSYASSTNLLIFNCNGSLAYKYRYKQSDANPGFKLYNITSPASIVSVDIGADQSSCCAGCTRTFYATVSPSGTYTYAWYVNSVLQTGSTGSSYIADGSNAKYNIKCKITSSPGGCTAIDSALYTVGNGPPCYGPLLGRYASTVEDSPMQNVLFTSAIQSLEPNPTDGIVNVKYTIGIGAQSAQLVLVNYSGQTISTVNLKPHESQLQIDSESLAPGLYFTTLIVDGKKVSTKKLIVTK